MLTLSNKKLGFGLMRLPLLNPSDQTSVDIEATKNMVDLFLSNGFTYFDTAWMYMGHTSENVAREALVERYPRDSFTLATKLHPAYFNNIAERDALFQKQLQKTGVEYFDFYLLHDVNVSTYEQFKKYDCFNWIQEQKKLGKIRHMGFSYHDNADLLDKVLTEHPEMEFVQLQINYLDWDSPEIQSRKCYEVAVKHGKPVVVMEPVKGGSLANVPDSVKTLFANFDKTKSIASFAIRFAASLENVRLVLSGMTTIEQMQDNLGYMQNFVPLTDEERNLVFTAAKIINGKVTIPCTACNYCTEGCPENIAIPKYFSIYNADKLECEEKTRWYTPQHQYYLNLTEKFGKPNDCVQCGQCEEACPQHLPIREHLKEVAKHFQG